MNKTLKYTLGASLTILALVACSKTDRSDESEMAVAEPVVQDIMAVCDEPSLKNRLVDALQIGLLDNALLVVQGYDDATRLGLEQQVRQQISKIGIDVQNVQSSGASCLADVYFSLPAQELSYADAEFARSGLMPLDEQAAEAGAALVGGNRLVVKGFSYVIENGKAVISADSALMNVLANTLVASSQGMIHESRRQARNVLVTPRLEVTDIVTPSVQVRSEGAENGRDDDMAQESTSPSEPKPKAQKPKEDNPPKANKPQESTMQKENVQPAQGEAELTIVESDETY